MDEQGFNAPQMPKIAMIMMMTATKRQSPVIDLAAPLVISLPSRYPYSIPKYNITPEFSFNMD
jgi:hypothetical protein